MRCKITGNPCGTDTRAEGQPCLCDACVASRLDISTGGERVLNKLKKMSDDELFELLDECSDGPVGRAIDGR